MNDYHTHGDLPDARPGIDPDFADEHYDPPQLNAGGASEKSVLRDVNELYA
jgi:hypothetical protein